MFFLAKDGGRGRNDVIKSQPLPFMRPAIVIVIAKSMEGKKDTARDGKLMIFFLLLFHLFLSLPHFDTLDGADINECEIDNGNCSNGTCVNTNGSFYCSCHKGFVMSEDDRYKCIRK